MIKAAFFDIDGTLVSFNTHKIPDSSLDALKRLREAGVRLFIASGRHRASMDKIEPYADLFDGYVMVNGGLWATRLCIALLCQRRMLSCGWNI